MTRLQTRPCLNSGQDAALRPCTELASSRRESAFQDAIRAERRGLDTTIASFRVFSPKDAAWIASLIPKTWLGGYRVWLELGAESSSLKITGPYVLTRRLRAAAVSSVCSPSDPAVCSP